MCNDIEGHVLWELYCEAMRHVGLEIPPQQSELDLIQADDIRIRDPASAAVRTPTGVELVRMRWGHLAPNGKPQPWLRAEGRSFAASRRCIVPASAFFEFTGSKAPKAKHRFTLAGAPFFGIAATWKPAVGNEYPSFATLTTGPGPDIAPYHDRQIVVLAPQDWRAWLDLTSPEADLLAPLPAGRLTVETVRGQGTML